ncbi:MAG: 23S rRNA (guanosine(2251)-2'-O)-methyltransferase RlmB [Balneolia bacterium]|nr:23S rRNA (guanosine(2251)-2'-O)-methyltransferase RlmB [Balneolia bacterium]
MSENNEYIYGIHPVEEALNNPDVGVEKIFVRQGLRSGAYGKISELASARRVPLVTIPGKKLYELVGKVNDQGIVAQLSGVAYTELEDWIETSDFSDNPFVVVLSEIEDTHNFGAILRSAAAAGAAAVIVPKHRQAPVNATVYKTSAGTAGKIPIIRVTNINQSIELLKEHGFWFAALEGTSDKTIWDEKYNAPMGIVVGSEGSGIRQKTAELCDFRLSIPMQNNVESLNASVSAALVMFEIQRRKLGLG